MSGFSPKRDWYLGEDEAWGVSLGGQGSAQTLPMTDDEKAAITKRPIGFVAPEKPKRRKRHPT